MSAGVVAEGTVALMLLTFPAVPDTMEVHLQARGTLLLSQAIGAPERVHVTGLRVVFDGQSQPRVKLQGRRISGTVGLAGEPLSSGTGRLLSDLEETNPGLAAQLIAQAPSLPWPAAP